MLKLLDVIVFCRWNKKRLVLHSLVLLRCSKSTKNDVLSEGVFLFKLCYCF